MARDYVRVQDYYMHLHELQPAPHFRYELNHNPNAGLVPLYEVTAGGCAEDHATLLPVHPPLPPPLPSAPLPNDHHKRKQHQYNALERFEMTSCEPPSLPPPSSTRKRKSASYGTPSTYDDDARSTRTLPEKKQNHSEIEKRRRDKMNTYICELSALVPVCGAMSRKLDKLTVLRLAVQHLRSVRGALAAYPLAARPRPHLLTERELNQLVLHAAAAADAFVLVVGCDRGRLLYVSASVETFLEYRQSELLGQSLFDILHPKDVGKVKEQLSSSDLNPRERLIDAKTMLPVKTDLATSASRLCPGARRSFLCRIKWRAPGAAPPTAPTVKEEPEPKMRKKLSQEKKYCVIQCTGYLKSWLQVDTSEGCSVSSVGSGGASGVTGGEGCDEGEGDSTTCLVAVCRPLQDAAPPPPLQPPARHVQFTSRHATDGKFLFVDQRVTGALGFLPQELLGSSLYEFVGEAQLGAVARAHKAALLRRVPSVSPHYAFRRKNGEYATVQTHFKPFRNPWTRDVECLVANNTVVSEDVDLAYDFYKQDDSEAPGVGAEGVGPECEGMQRAIDSQLESHKIGSAIAEEALRRSSPEFSPELLPELLQDTVFNSQASLVDNILDGGYEEVRNNVSLSAAGPDSSPRPGHSRAEGESEAAGGGATPPPTSPPLPPLGLDGNGEAAMAVIMSLLEADAGLGGPVNFSGLPWPLP